MGTANLSDIVSNQTAGAKPAGGTASLSDIVSTAPTTSSPNIAAQQATIDAINPSGTVGAGAAKGAVDTMRGAADLVGGTGMADKIGVPNIDTAPQGIAEHIGKGGESVLEFMLGQEALKGLSLGAKLEKIAPTIKAIESHPQLAKVVGNALRNAAVGGTEGAVKAPDSSRASGAAVGAGIGAAGSVAADVVPMIPRYNPFHALTGKNIQPEFQSGIREVWNKAAADAGVPTPTKATSVQDLGQEVGDAVLARSKAAYRMIDDATGNRFSGTEQALKAVNNDLRFVTDDASEEKLFVRKTRLEMQMGQMLDDAEAKGVPKSTVDAAKADFKKAQAIYDTNQAITRSTTGVRPGMQGAKDVPEEVNAKSMMNRMNKLYNTGRLQQAVGDDGAEDLIGHSAKAQKAARNVARNRTVAKTVASAAGVGTGYELVKHLAP